MNEEQQHTNGTATRVAVEPSTALQVPSDEDRLAAFIVAVGPQAMIARIDGIRFAHTLVGVRAMEQKHKANGDWLADSLAAFARQNGVTRAQLLDAAHVLTQAATFSIE